MQRPTKDELERLARENYFSLSEEEIRVFEKRIDEILSSYEKLDMITTPRFAMPQRDKGHFPTKQENAFRAWAWKCSIKESDSGPLSGMKVAVKDNMAVRGIPLANGSPMLESYIPDEDATVVSRILQAGAEIVGKSQCENLCVSGGSHTSFPSPVRNPRNPRFMAGGSSSGSAALLAGGKVDLALGGDQAGSIRIPSSWCGVYGLKPTWGLVPYTGAVPMEMSLDHLGPMANSVKDVALLLEVIAGRDEFDPRQRDTPLVLPRYSRELYGGVNGLSIGAVKEGFGWEGISEEEVDEIVRREAMKFQKLGAKVRDVSVPQHRTGIDVWTSIVIEGTWSTSIRDNGIEHCGNGYNNVHFIEIWAAARKKKSDMLPPTMKLIALLGNFLGEKYNGRYFALCQSMRRTLRQNYDRVFQDFDLLLMPTTPQRAQLLRQMNLEENLSATTMNLYNTCPFDVTGHPAMSVPCGTSEGLPVGMMLVGKHFDEVTILRAAYAFEQA